LIIYTKIENYKSVINVDKML